jgi:thiamine-monophosphate kinase
VGDTPRTVSDLGEDALVSGVLSQYPPPPSWVPVGPGDDAAVIDLSGRLVVSTDTLVEGRDFDRAYSSGDDLGVKVAAQALADVAAMGGRPRALLVALAVPGAVPAQFATDLARGLQRECRRAGAVIVGGDVSDAGEIVLTATAIGVLDGAAPPVLRSGARPGDLVALAGTTGASAAGLALLQAGTRGVDVAGGAGAALARLLVAHRAPAPPYDAGPAARLAGAHALIDTSDSLLRDAARVAAASGVVLDLDSAALPEVPDLAVAAVHLGAAADEVADLVRRWQLTGGEDHALVACFDPASALPEEFTVIGSVHACGRQRRPQVLVDGAPWAGPLGWTHWRP